MKTAYCIAVLIALSPGMVLAAPKGAATGEKDCQTIKSITVRQACLDREAAEHPVQQQPANMGNAVDDLKREDDILAKKLKSICRGC
jgi:hypothetical protein